MNKGKFKDKLCKTVVRFQNNCYHEQAKNSGLENIIYALNVDASWNFKSVVVSTSDRQVNLYDLKDGTHLQTISCHTDRINSVKFSKDDENFLVTCSDDGTTKVWDLRTKNCVIKKNGKGEFGSAALNSKYLAAGLGSDVLLWDLRRNETLISHRGEDGLVCLFNFGKEDDEALESVINTQSCISNLDLLGTRHEIFYTISPTEQLQIGNVFDAKIGIDYGLEFRGVLSELCHFEINYLICCKYYNDSLVLFAGSFDGRVAVFELSDGKVQFVTPLHGHDSIVRDVFLSPDGSLCITVGEDSKMLFWTDLKDHCNTLSLKYKKSFVNKNIADPY